MYRSGRPLGPTPWARKHNINLSAKGEIKDSTDVVKRAIENAYGVGGAYKDPPLSNSEAIR